jgi:hypothetical protein
MMSDQDPSQIQQPLPQPPGSDPFAHTQPPDLAQKPPERSAFDLIVITVGLAFFVGMMIGMYIGDFAVGAVVAVMGTVAGAIYWLVQTRK